MTVDFRGQTACVRVFGCQMNVYDGQLAETMLRQAGCEIIDDPARADIAVFVTCSVRAHAENRVFSLLGRLRLSKLKNGGRPIIGIMGCTAQRLGMRFIKRYPFIDFIIGTHHIEQLVEAVAEALYNGRQTVLTDQVEQYVLESVAARPANSYFAYVPVARGCSRRCAYCIVPYVRGPMSSRSPEDIIDQVRDLTEQGYTEITLLGQNVDAYGRDSGFKPGLAGLLKRIVELNGIVRLNFITSHPADFKDDILEVMRDYPVISPFFHLPPQSGSNAVLKRMGRGYTREYYIDLVGRIRDVLPYAELAGDFIVGFPGETEDDFNESLDLLKTVAFQQVYVFKYSPREGTRAALNMVDDIPIPEKRRRNVQMLTVQEEIQMRKHTALVGKTLDVIVEGVSKKDSGKFFGRSDTNFRIVFDKGREQPGDRVPILIESATALTLFGKIIA